MSLIAFILLQLGNRELPESKRLPRPIVALIGRYMELSRGPIRILAPSGFGGFASVADAPKITIPTIQGSIRWVVGNIDFAVIHESPGYYTNYGEVDENGRLWVLRRGKVSELDLPRVLSVITVADDQVYAVSETDVYLGGPDTPWTRVGDGPGPFRAIYARPGGTFVVWRGFHSLYAAMTPAIWSPGMQDWTPAPPAANDRMVVYTGKLGGVYVCLTLNFLHHWNGADEPVLHCVCHPYFSPCEIRAAAPISPKELRVLGITVDENYGGGGEISYDWHAVLNVETGELTHTCYGCGARYVGVYTGFRNGYICDACEKLEVDWNENPDCVDSGAVIVSLL